MCNNGLISLHSCSPMMTCAAKLFYISSFPFSAQIILHQDVSTFVLVALTLSRAKPIITVNMMCKIKVMRVAGKHS